MKTLFSAKYPCSDLGFCKQGSESRSKTPFWVRTMYLSRKLRVFDKKYAVGTAYGFYLTGEHC